MEELLPGMRAMAQRITNAENDFVEVIMNMGYTKSQADHAMRVMLNLKVAKLDPVGGTIRVKHGMYLEPHAVENAVNYIL